MKKQILPFVLAGLLTGCSSTQSTFSGVEPSLEEQAVSSSADRVPYILFHDFETGELYGWEPYPYQQDVGYDALYFTRQSPTYNNSRYALARPVRANHTVELYQGFTRRLDLWTTPDTRVKAALFFQSDRNPETLEISLGTFDGRTFTHTLHSPEANTWLELDLPMGVFRRDGQSLAAGEHIQVVTLEASYPIVYHLFTYTILMDDFQINGERQRRFVASDPGSTHLEEFGQSILHRHFHYGETISLSAFPERGVPLERVWGTLLDSRGEVVRDRIPFERRGGQWVNESIHRLRESDARGQWEIRLQGETAGGGSMEWGFRFLMPGDPVTDHPRLFFSREELQERLATEDSPAARRILDNALSNTAFMNVDIDAINEKEDRTGEALTGGPYSRWREAYGDWNGPMSQLGNVIREGSFRYAFTGDEAAGLKAKEALLKLVSFEKWNAAWMLENQFWTYYPVGYTLKPVAYGYDMLHDLLSEEEKRLVREAIIEKGLKLFHRDMVEMNRFPSNNTNHQSVLASGHGLAATAIYGDDPDNPYLEPYLSGIMAKAKTFIDRTYYEDGSYGEPYSYQAMATRSLVEILATFERNFGVDWSTTTDVQHFYKYTVQVTDNEGRGHLGFGDGSVSAGHLSQVHAQWFVHRTGNPFLYNYVKPYWEAGNGGYMGYLWYRDDITPQTREILPTSRVFDDAFGMVMRSGWEDEATIITTRVGPHSNHFHFNQGSFLIMKNGENLLYDAAHGGAYYENLLFPVYNIQAISKNVMLVDHDPESQKAAHYDIGIAAHRDWPRMTLAFAGEIADALEADLATVYKGKLRNYTRSLLFTKSGPLFLMDRVRSVSADGHVYSWLFHAQNNAGGERSIRHEGNRVSIDRPNARLTIDILSDNVESVEINDTPFNESFVSLNSREGLTDTYFFAVLLPEAGSGGEFGPRPRTQRLDERGWVGARVERPGAVDLAFFRTSPDAAAEVEGFASDSERFMVSLDGSGRLVKAWFEGSSLEGAGLSVQSDFPVVCAVAPEAEGLQVEVEAERATRLSLSLPGRPAEVLFNGTRTGDWRYDAATGRLTVRVSEGRTDISIR